MDVAAGEYGQVLAQLVASVENGRLIYREETVDSGSPTPIRSNHYITSVTSVHGTVPIYRSILLLRWDILDCYI